SDRNDEGPRRDARRRQDECVRHGGACSDEAGNERRLRGARQAARASGRGGHRDRAGTAIARRRVSRSRRRSAGPMMKAVAVARKELRQIVRDKRTLFILLFVPVLFLLLFGYALNWDIRHVRLAVDDRDHTPESRSIIAAFVNSGYFDLVRSTDAPGIDALMNSNHVRAGR